MAVFARYGESLGVVKGVVCGGRLGFLSINSNRSRPSQCFSITNTHFHKLQEATHVLCVCVCIYAYTFFMRSTHAIITLESLLKVQSALLRKIDPPYCMVYDIVKQ